MATYDVILRGGRVLDPGTGRDEVTDIAFDGGKVAAVGEAAKAGRGRSERKVEGCIVTAGQIDLHAHVYWGGTSLGIDADSLSRRCGTTTWLDVGSAGAGNMPGFEKHVIQRSETRVLAYMHISFAGIYAFSKDIMVGESQDLRLLDASVCAREAVKYPDVVRGIKVRVGANTSGANGITPLYLAIEAADKAGLPCMCHIDRPPPRYVDVLNILRPGDILDSLLQAVPECPDPCRRADQGRCLAGAREGGLFRHRARQGLVLVPYRAPHAGTWLPARRDQLGRPHALHRRSGL